MRVPTLESPIEMPSTAAPANAATRGHAGAKLTSISAAGHHAKARFCGGSDSSSARKRSGTGSFPLGPAS